MQRVYILTILFLLIMKTVLAQENVFLTVNVFGEQIQYQAEIDEHTPKHLVREFSIATLISSSQYVVNKRVNKGLTRIICYTFNFAYEHGQAGWGGAASVTDFLAGVIGTELAIVPWYFIKSKTEKSTQPIKAEIVEIE